VYARPNFYANLQVHRPPKPLWNPRLREAATTLAATEWNDGANINERKLDTVLLSPR
jgi:hypothetical protein